MTTTDAQRAEIMALIAKGSHPVPAAMRAGVSWDAVTADLVLFREICQAVQVFLSKLHSRMLDLTLRSGVTPQRLIILEREVERRGIELAKLQEQLKRLEVTDGDGDAGIDLSKMTDFELRAAEALLSSDLERFQELLRQEVIARAQPIARQMSEESMRRRMERTRPDALELLDEREPLPASRSVVATGLPDVWPLRLSQGPVTR